MRRISSLSPRARVQREHLGVLTRVADGAQGTVFRTEGMQIRRRPALYKRYKAETLAGLDVTALEAMVDHVREMTPEVGAHLLDIAAWPVSTVLSSGATDGCLMPEAPRRFDATLHLPSGATKVRPAHFEQLLNSDQFTRRQLGRPVPDQVRLRLLASVASHLDWLHAHGIVVGDLSPTNLLFSVAAAGDPDTYFIDCDAMALDGVSCLEAVETPDWRVRESYPDEHPATAQSDDYKLALLVLRTLVRDQHKRVAAALPGWASPELRPMLEAGLGPAGGRPGASEWAVALAGVASDIAAGRITPGGSGARRPAVLPVTRRLTPAPTPVASVRRPRAAPGLALPPVSAPSPQAPAPEAGIPTPLPIAEVAAPHPPPPTRRAVPDPAPPAAAPPVRRAAPPAGSSPAPPAPGAVPEQGPEPAPASRVPTAAAQVEAAPPRVDMATAPVRPRAPRPRSPVEPESQAPGRVIPGLGLLDRAGWRRGAIAGLGVTAVAVAALILVLVTGIWAGGLGNGTGAGDGGRSGPTPRARPTAVPTPVSTPVPGTALVSGTFSLRYPAGVHIAQNVGDSVTLYQSGTDSGVLVQTVTVAPTTAAALQARVLANMRTQYGTVGTCVDREALTIDGVSGILNGYFYVYPSGGGTPVCNTFWFGTNAGGTVEYMFQEFANQSDYGAWDPLATNIRDSISWST